MTGVPPFPWTEVVTRRDLEAFGKELRGELLEKVGAQTGKLVAANFASSLTSAGLVLAVVRLA